MIGNQNYADQFCDWLVELGYTHCFLLPGGNIMHLIEAVRTKFECVPVIHEVSAVIAADYFNETSDTSKAFALVTAGPGLTNCMSGITGAWLESREVLIIGGQVKSKDLASEGLRLRGIQEVDGMSLFKSVTKSSMRIEYPKSKEIVVEKIISGNQRRPGPVYIEFCLDAQGAKPIKKVKKEIDSAYSTESHSFNQSTAILEMIKAARRPIILLGGSVSRVAAKDFIDSLDLIGIPVMTTWNAADRIPSSHQFNWGRPQTQGQRSANLLIQQSDLLVAIGTRLGLQQTGFNWQEFCPLAKVVQIFEDSNELAKGHPRIDLAVNENPNVCLSMIKTELLKFVPLDLQEWINFGTKVRSILPINEDSNRLDSVNLNPYDFITFLSESLIGDEIVVSSSSGGTFTLVMQGFTQKSNQKIVSSGALASMGYAIPGAIGAAFANPNHRVVVVEGDGSFAQSIQELGTIARSRLPIKIVVIDNNGYGSIKKTQANYFSGEYLGCDYNSGLGLPNWGKTFEAFGIDYRYIEQNPDLDLDLVSKLLDQNPFGVIVKIDSAQTFYPRIPNRVQANGDIESSALHEMYPTVEDSIRDITEKYLRERGSL